MYDLIIYLIKHDKLDLKFYNKYDSLIEEIKKGENQLSKNFDKEMKKIHKIQRKTINISMGMTEYLSKDQEELHNKRRFLTVINFLISIIFIILTFKYSGIVRIMSLIMSISTFGTNIAGNIIINNIIESKDEIINTLSDGVEDRNNDLCKLQEEYVNFAGKQISEMRKEIDIYNDKNASSKIIQKLKEKNIGLIEQISFYDEEPKEESKAPSKEQTNEYKYDEKKEYFNHYEDNQDITIPKTRSKKRIKRDGDK